LGRYLARRFDARNHQAKPIVARMTGLTIASMIAIESRRISFYAAPTGPCGSSTPPQPARGNSKSAAMAMTFYARKCSPDPVERICGRLANAKT
jgi:hypothetical protein